jgi:hypothetical protein
LKYLKNISEGWPEIAWLADFMEVGTSPTKWKYLTKAHTEERAKRTRVTIVELTPGEESTRKDIQKSEQLAEVLNDPAFADPEYARIIIVEDLSRDVIEALGTKYDINPSFFRGQISDFLWFNTRDPWVELSDLDHVGSERNYFNVRYMRPRYFASEASIKDAKDALGSFNVLRHVEEDLSWRVRELKKPVGPTVGVVRSKTSLWIRKNKAGEKGVIGMFEILIVNYIAESIQGFLSSILRYLKVTHCGKDLIIYVLVRVCTTLSLIHRRVLLYLRMPSITHATCPRMNCSPFNPSHILSDSQSSTS